MPTPLDLVSNADLANDSQIRDWSHVQFEHKWRLLHKCGSDKIMQGTGGKKDYAGNWWKRDGKSFPPDKLGFPDY